jgi:hypothetical protein
MDASLCTVVILHQINEYHIIDNEQEDYQQLFKLNFGKGTKYILCIYIL